MFDHLVAVDWSAAARPCTGRDSIWIATCDVAGRADPADAQVRTCNPRTRHAAIDELGRHLRAHARAGRRVLVGWDFCFGFPAGTAEAAGLTRDGVPPWQALWCHLRDVVRDDPDNANNRFSVAADLNRRLGPGPGPFWGCPAPAVRTGLHERRTHTYPYRTAAGTDLPEYRLTETTLRAAGHRVHSPWKCYTAGSVGGQTILGLAALEGLRRDPDLAPATRVWPLEPVDGAALVVHAECWPGLFPPDDTREVRDEAQVAGVVRGLGRAIRSGTLSSWLAVPGLLPSQVCDEEGWVLGWLAPGGSVGR